MFLCTEVLYVALEYLPNGDLRSYLRTARPESDSDESLSSEQLVAFALDVVKGMEHLATSSVCQNQTVCPDEECKVAQQYKDGYRYFKTKDRICNFSQTQALPRIGFDQKQDVIDLFLINVINILSGDSPRLSCKKHPAWKRIDCQSF